MTGPWNVQATGRRTGPGPEGHQRQKRKARNRGEAGGGGPCRGEGAFRQGPLRGTASLLLSHHAGPGPRLAGPWTGRSLKVLPELGFCSPESHPGGPAHRRPPLGTRAKEHQPDHRPAPLGPASSVREMKVRVPRRASCRLRWGSVSTGLPPVIRLWPGGWADPAIGPGDRALETHTYRPSLILRRPGPLSERQRPVLVPTVVADSLSSQPLAPGMRSFPCEACGASEVAAPDGWACPLHPPYYNLPCSVARGPGSPTGQSRDKAAHLLLVSCLTNYATHRKT